MTKQAEILKIRKEISSLNDEVQRALQKIPRKLEELQTKILNSMDLEEQPSFDHNLTFISKQEVTERMSDPEYRNLSKIAKQSDEAAESFCLVGCDGSYRETNRLPTSLAAAYFSSTSALNIANQLRGDGTSLICELHAINLALKNLSEVKVKNTIIVVDNAVAIDEATLVIQREAHQSNSLQKALERSHLHSKTLQEIRKSSNNFHNIIFTWQRSHVTIDSIFAEFNDRADQLCLDKFAEIARNNERGRHFF